MLNLRHLNKFLLIEKFKYEDLRLALLMFRKGDYAFTFDLKSGYHHVDIQHILGYLNTLGQTKQFPVHISEFVHISEEAINR